MDHPTFIDCVRPSYTYSQAACGDIFHRKRNRPVESLVFQSKLTVVWSDEIACIDFTAILHDFFCFNYVCCTRTLLEFHNVSTSLIFLSKMNHTCRLLSPGLSTMNPQPSRFCSAVKRDYVTWQSEYISCEGHQSRRLRPSFCEQYGRQECAPENLGEIATSPMSMPLNSARDKWIGPVIFRHQFTLGLFI